MSPLTPTRRLPNSAPLASSPAPSPALRQRGGPPVSALRTIVVDSDEEDFPAPQAYATPQLLSQPRARPVALSSPTYAAPAFPGEPLQPLQPVSPLSMSQHPMPAPLPTDPGYPGQPRPLSPTRGPEAQYLTAIDTLRAEKAIAVAECQRLSGYVTTQEARTAALEAALRQKHAELAAVQDATAGDAAALGKAEAVADQRARDAAALALERSRFERQLTQAQRDAAAAQAETETSRAAEETVRGELAALEQRLADSEARGRKLQGELADRDRALREEERRTRGLRRELSETTAMLKEAVENAARSAQDMAQLRDDLQAAKADAADASAQAERREAEGRAREEIIAAAAAAEERGALESLLAHMRAAVATAVDGGLELVLAEEERGRALMQLTGEVGAEALYIMGAYHRQREEGRAVRSERDALRALHLEGAQAVADRETHLFDELLRETSEQARLADARAVAAESKAAAAERTAASVTDLAALASTARRSLFQVFEHDEWREAVESGAVSDALGARLLGAVQAVQEMSAAAEAAVRPAGLSDGLSPLHGGSLFR